MTQNAQLSGVTWFRTVFHAIALLAIVVFGALPMLAQFDTGTITGTGIRGKIDGIGFTADLAISIQANRQSVTIEPTGATDISQVALTLTRI